MKRIIAFLCALFLIISVGFSQSLLNKLKNKANQEVYKLESKSGSGNKSTPNKNKLSSNVTRTAVVSLGSNEIFDYQENCIDLGASIDQVSFIITKRVGNSTQCYSYKNGTRTPIACPLGTVKSECQTSLQCSYAQLKELDMNGDDYKKYVVNETETHNVQQPAISDQQMKAMAAYMTPAQLEEMKKNLAEAQKQSAGQTYSTIKSSKINFNGITYGPYKQVAKFYLTPDGSNFYAIVSEAKSSNAAQFQNKIITSTSQAVFMLDDYSTTLSCFASADNSEFGYVTVGMTDQKYIITTSSGKKYDMPMSNGFAGAWFSATGNHVIYLSQSQLYFDGQVIQTFAAGMGANPCDLFVSSDGKGVTIIKNNTISFADGDYFEYPLKIATATVGGKTYYKWLALENQEVVVYQKPY